MASMFAKTTFSGDISNWDVSRVTDMRSMFGRTAFDGDISKWKVSRVTDMSNMSTESNFNGDISKWDVSRVKDMDEMFMGAILFTQQLSEPAWVYSKASKEDMFEGSSG